MFEKKSDAIVISVFVVMALAARAAVMNMKNPEAASEPQKPVAIQPEKVETPTLEPAPSIAPMPEPIPEPVTETVQSSQVPLQDAEKNEIEEFQNMKQLAHTEDLIRAREIEDAIEDAHYKSHAAAIAKSQQLFRIKEKALADFQSLMGEKDKVRAQAEAEARKKAQTQAQQLISEFQSRLPSTDIETLRQIANGNMIYYRFCLFNNFTDPNDVVEVSLNGKIIAVTNVWGLSRYKIPVDKNATSMNLSFRQINDGDGRGMDFEAHLVNGDVHEPPNFTEISISGLDKITTRPVRP